MPGARALLGVGVSAARRFVRRDERGSLGRAELAGRTSEEHTDRRDRDAELVGDQFARVTDAM